MKRWNEGPTTSSRDRIQNVLRLGVVAQQLVAGRCGNTAGMSAIAPGSSATTRIRLARHRLQVLAQLEDEFAQPMWPASQKSAASPGVGVGMDESRKRVAAARRGACAGMKKWREARRDRSEVIEGVEPQAAIARHARDGRMREGGRKRK